METRIYLVEDDAVIAGAVARHMEAWGCRVKAAEDFSNILEEFRSFAPQLVLLDIYLPFFNGYHWCTEIRKISRVPIIFLSSASDNMNIVMAMNMGGDDFIAKPFDLEVLTAKVQALDLSRNEYRILQVLLENRGRTVSREALMQKLWETDSFVDENTLSVNMNRLRRKLDGMGLEGFIRTKKGLGYLVE